MIENGYINLVCTASITFCFYKELKEGLMGEKCSWSECKVRSSR